jgi:uncharacterized membrane protein required for colicin V production
VAWITSLSLVDYAFLAVLTGALITGWIKGLVQILTGFVVFAVTLFVAGRYTGPVVAWFNERMGVTVWLQGLMQRRLELPAESHKVPATIIPVERAAEWLELVPLPPSYKAELATRLTTWSDGAVGQTAAEFILHTLVNALVHATAFILIAVVVGAILGLLSRVISTQVKEIPLVGTINSLLGAAAAAAQTAVVLALVVGVVLPSFSLYGLAAWGEAVEQAQLTPYLHQLFEGLREMVFGTAGRAFLVGRTE